MRIRRRRGPRWWLLVPAVSLVAVSAGILVNRWGSVRASQPAYLVTLVAVAVSGLVATAGSLWNLHPPSDRRRSPGWTVVRRALLSVGTGVLVVVLVLLRPLPATPAAVASMRSGSGVAVSVSSSLIRLDPEKARTQTGLVFYPGALVDPRAYVPLLRPIADAGFTVDIVKPPYGIALLSLRAPATVIAGDPSVRRWVVGGHSLGGVAAASFAGRGNPEVRGLLLWASYPNRSLASHTTLLVTSISAGNDGLATPAKIEGSRADLPPETRFVVVGGAVHAHFGDYGPQRGDGAPTIGAAEAQRQIEQATLALLVRVNDLGRG